jgi:hypothetical protein
MVCNLKVKTLSKDAPALCRQHLLDIISSAEDSGDSNGTKEILKILQREAQKKRWKRINYSTCPPRGGTPLAIQVQTSTTVKTHDTEETIFEHAAEHLSLQFRLANSALIYSSTLLDNIGHLGDTQCALNILDGSYAFPPATNKWTIKILQEAHHTYKLLNSGTIKTRVSIEDYQEYWQQSDEAISSSYSRGHRGHYKAASYSRDLSALQATTLSACAKKGVPLARWGVGLTLLLEKTPQNNLINKMRVICLFEADFNWLNKLIYARRMMNSALDEKLIPLECFAKKGSNCVNAVMTKIMYCNKSRMHHHPMIVLCNDFADCYDRVALPVAAVTLQSFGIPIEAVRVLLLAMQTMKYFLQTGFGESLQSYGGSLEDRIQGFGQDNAAARPGFLVISTQIVNAYLQNGHGS